MSNFYATDVMGGEFASKKAFREFFAAHPSDVRFEDTSAFNNRGVFFGAANLTSSDVIVGPNPWNKRNWYANVKNGRVV